LQGIGDRDDLQDPRVSETLHAPTHARFRKTDFVSNRTVGSSPVALQEPDDLSINRVERARYSDEFHGGTVAALRT
jgi:hypothetical protein